MNSALESGLLLIVFYPLLMFVVNVTMHYYRKLLKKPSKYTYSALSFGIVCVSLAMHSTGASALTVSSSSAAQYGLAGPLWYLFGTMTPLCLMAIIVSQFRSRAPGATTFPQLMLARFGKRVHLMFCCLTILNNITIIVLVVNTGCMFYSAISKNITFELAWIVTVIVAEICAGIGTMKHLTTFTFILFIYLLVVALAVEIKVFFADGSDLVGTIEKVYNSVVALEKQSTQGSPGFLTMRSYAAIEMGVHKLLLQTREILYDQAFWDVCFFFVPGQEAWGITATSLIWGAFPLIFGTSCGLGTLALNITGQGYSPSTVPTVDIVKHLLGQNGTFVLFSLYAFVTTTATVLQIFSVSKILTFDIYAVHWKPFRVCYDLHCCVFCGKSKDEETRPKDKCECSEITDCAICQEDAKTNNQNYTITCRVHGLYLKYSRGLKSIHRSCVLLVLCVVVPLGLFLNYITIGEMLLSQLPQCLMSGSIGSFILALYWTRLTEIAIFVGTFVSSCLALAAGIVLHEVVKNKALTLNQYEITILTCSTGIICGFLIPVIVTLVSKKSSKSHKARLSWERALDLIDPIKPWTNTYSELFHLELSATGLLTPKHVVSALKTSRMSGYIGLAVYLGVMALVLSLGCIPERFNLVGFKVWIISLLVLLCLSILAAVLLPILSELSMARRQGFAISEKNCRRPTCPEITIIEESLTDS